MKTVLVETPIPAPAHMVWDVLTDFPRYAEWNPFITSIEGDLQLGAKLRATFELPGRKPQVFTPTITVLDPGHQLGWLGRLWIPRLVDAEHSLEIVKSDSGPVFVQRETFQGALVPLLGVLVQKTNQAFAAMNDALVQRVGALGGRSG
jgi:hypothetical protein